MTIEFDLDQFSERGRKLLLMRANQWGCAPAVALGRLLDEAAAKARVKAAVIPDEASADADLAHRQVIGAPDGGNGSERRAA